MQVERRKQEVSARRNRLITGGAGTGFGTVLAVLVVGHLKRHGTVLTIDEATALGGVLTGGLTGLVICLHDLRSILCPLIYKLIRRK